MITSVRKILIANRGEIAVRIIKTCNRLGISTVAVYSDADSKALHVRLADESVFIGRSPARDSYLNISRILEAALQTGAEAIHPGYGFLSENDLFAAAAEEAGLIFIGPTSESIRMMGNKLTAKQIAKSIGIPMVPGSETAVTDIKEVKLIAARTGFPLLIKAAAGGGGKGMRIVHSPDEMESHVERAMSEALSSFGDGSVFVEKYITSPRHIELQVMADKYGNCIHLFERECSIQRRHQKIIEEAPSSILDKEKRDTMGRDAIMIAQSCHYTGAGTVEFLLDEKGNHYFLEMNTRLQVEHPVTEMITGLDLVEYQIRVAEGHPLLHQQKDVKINGHAMELRVYAENVSNGFIPSTGRLKRYKEPLGTGIRVDGGYEEGMEIPIHYDPMISKLIAYGSSRKEAIEILKSAIKDYEIHGVETTLAFGNFTLSHPDFVAGKFDTQFVEKYLESYKQKLNAINTSLAKFAAWLYHKRRRILSLPDMD